MLFGTQCSYDLMALQVCYHSRDFPVGGIILESIQSAIEHSKRVICLMSNDFIRSEFCMLEFLAAWHRDIEHRKHRLIVLKWPDLDLDADVQLADVSQL